MYAHVQYIFDHEILNTDHRLKSTLPGPGQQLEHLVEGEVLRVVVVVQPELPDDLQCGGLAEGPRGHDVGGGCLGGRL